MTVQELFEEVKFHDPEFIPLFWEGIKSAIEADTYYAGVPANEIKAYLELNELKYACACGNQPFNCICYSDAE